MQVTGKLSKFIILLLYLTIFTGCVSYTVLPGKYVYHNERPTNKKSVVGFVYELNVMYDSTYKYSYRNSGNYQEHSYGTWSITPSGRLMLWDSLPSVTQIPIKVQELGKGETGTTVFEFSPSLEPAFWNLVIDNVIYPIIEKSLIIPREINSDHFYLLGFNKEYEGLNSPYEIVKTELYQIKDKNNQLFSIELPGYASNYEILFYKPMHDSFIIKKQKLIQDSNNLEYRVSQ